MKNALQSSLDAAFGSGVFTVTKNDRSGIITIAIETQSEVKVLTNAELIIGQAHRLTQVS